MDIITAITVKEGDVRSLLSSNTAGNTKTTSGKMVASAILTKNKKEKKSRVFIILTLSKKQNTIFD